MSISQNPEKPQLEPHLSEIYSYLHRLYRQGDFELTLECYSYAWPELNDNADFYDYQTPPKNLRFTTHTIKYAEAVENLYQLVLFLEQTMKSWIQEHEVEILQIMTLIYEVKDYSLNVPPKLGDFVLQQARAFNKYAKRNEIEHFADELRRKASPLGEPDDDRARVIKVQSLTALCGVNHLYRSHLHGHYDEALEIVRNIETYVKEKLPHQHRNVRQSFGLIGLTMYLKGRLLSAMGDYDNAQKAYAQSSDAYVARLDQKNSFSERGFITKEQYEEKKFVTLRRAALVSALGVGYLAFISSRVSKALAALRMSRAALKQNVGAVYGAYTDILFYACRRAEGSSDRQTIEDVIHGIEVCRETLAELVPDSHYLHRAGIELAIALHYRMKFDQKAGNGSERASEDYARAMELLEAAIKQSETIEEGRVINQRLLTEALFIRSYIRRCLPDITTAQRHVNLAKAEEDARRALKEAGRNPRMECEALIALGSVQYDQARYYKSSDKEEDFHKKLSAAQNSFRDALKTNDKKNVRIEAICYLKLTKLSLFDPSSVALAHDYFKRWKEIENRVEHAFCHYMAQEINKRLSEGGPLLIINAEASLNYPEWENKLLTHLLNTMLIELSEETKKHQYNESKLHKLLSDALINRLKFKRSTAYKILDKHKLVEQLQQRNKQSI
jgi:hypothetical protein